ncbi:MAG: hypothetical protein FWD69_11645 [Polyangiaceae bacterium]|nr:hypothetical protein [Polyangiaceae bacterium]
MHKVFLPIALLTVASGLPIACSSNNPPPAAPTPNANAGATWDSGAPPVAPPVANDTGTPNLLEATMDAAIDLAIRNQSAQAAPSMTPEGQAGRATLQQGQSFSMVVTLQPNQCYTVIGYSPPGQVTQLDMKLMAQPLNIQAGASSTKEKNLPVIGKGKTAALCPILPVPIAYRLDAVATQGAGRIGVQVFSRPK